jgi:hypothetical protein
VGIGNDSTWWLALVYGGTCGSVLNFQWLGWLVMELEIGTWRYLWVCVHTYGFGWVPWGACGLELIVHGVWHWYMGVRVGPCCIFSGCGGWSWSLNLGTWGYLWVRVGSYGCGWYQEGAWGLGMIVYVVGTGICGYVWVHAVFSVVAVAGHGA